MERLRSKLVHPADLTPWPENPRTITDRQYAALKKALEDDPQMIDARPLVALPDGTVIAGNMRLRAMLDLGWQKVPVVYRDLSPTEARKVALRDNAQFGEWQEDELTEMLVGLNEQGIDLTTLGLDDKAVEGLVRGTTTPEPDRNPIAPQYGVILVLPDEQVQSRIYGELYAAYGDDPDIEVRVVVT